MSIQENEETQQHCNAIIKMPLLICVIRNVPQQPDIHSVLLLHAQGSFFLDLEAHKAEESAKITRFDHKLPQHCKSKNKKKRTEINNIWKLQKGTKRSNFCPALSTLTHLHGFLATFEGKIRKLHASWIDFSKIPKQIPEGV